MGRLRRSFVLAGHIDDRRFLAHVRRAPLGELILMQKIYAMPEFRNWRRVVIERAITRAMQPERLASSS